MILFLLLLVFGSSSVSVGSRSVLREISNKDGEQFDYAVDLNATNFDAVLKETPATYALVEFFAHWYIFLAHFLIFISIYFVIIFFF